MRCESHHETSSLSPAERSARREVRLLRSFYRHLAIYLIVNGAFAIFHLLSQHEMRHAPVLMVGWGIGLAIHGLRVLMGGRWLGHEWEEAQVKARLHQEVKP